jgi:hypothetical protein
VTANATERSPVIVCGFGCETVPLSQVKVTLTEPPELSGCQSFVTVKCATLSMFTIVQKRALRRAEQVPVDV